MWASTGKIWKKNKVEWKKHIFFIFTYKSENFVKSEQNVVRTHVRVSVIFRNSGLVCKDQKSPQKISNQKINETFLINLNFRSFRIMHKLVPVDLLNPFDYCLCVGSSPHWAAQSSAVDFSSVQCTLVQCSIVHFTVVQCRIVQRSEMQCNTLHCSAAQFRAVAV